MDPIPCWYAAYTLPRHEKAVAEQLARSLIETYVPLYRAVRGWRGRRAEVDLPLFPSYVFVRISLTEHLKVLRHPSVVRFISFNGKPARLPNEEIGLLQKSLAACHAEPYPFFTRGKRVR